MIPIRFGNHFDLETENVTIPWMWRWNYLAQKNVFHFCNLHTFHSTDVYRVQGIQGYLSQETSVLWICDKQCDQIIGLFSNIWPLQNWILAQ